MKKPISITTLAAALLVAAQAFAVTAVFAAETATITTVEPTPLFPQPAAGQPLRQLVRLHLANPGAAFAASARITLGTQALEAQPVQVATGKSAIAIQIPDIAAPTPVTIELLGKDGTVLAAKKLDWQPQKKWTIYCCSYSHQDLGFGDYPHRLRTAIRHENIKLPLKFCRETDAWPDNAKYRFNIETSEPITSFISFNGKDAARELGQRIREGRIELGGLHNTVLSEELSHELMARLFYMAGRYSVDLLGAPAGKTIVNNDLIGLTWPLATYAKEAGFDYCFHGYNRLAMPNINHGKVVTNMKSLDGEQGRQIFSIGNEPNFYWQGPDGQQLLRRATTYERNDLLSNPYDRRPSDIQDPARVEYLIRGHEGMKWPFHAMLSQDGGDFILVRRAVSNRALKWNAEYSWPKIRMATFDEYFRAIELEMSERKIKLNTIGGDENNEWSDMDYADAKTTAEARRLSERLPATESLSVMAQAAAGGGDQWINLFQGYHRLLQYFEHSNGKYPPNGHGLEKWRWYETENQENREMVSESAHYQKQAFDSASQRLAGAVMRTGKENIIVFNPLPCPRTDIVRAVIPAGELVDETGKAVVVQQMPDGSALFKAENIPATGYKTYSFSGKPHPAATPASGILESKFYRITVDPVTGSLTSLFDKTLGVELAEANAPHAFNEYLYEYRTGYKSAWSRMEKADSVAVVHGPVADVLTVTGKANGVKSLKQTVLLYHDLPRVDFTLEMDKLPFTGNWPTKNHEAVFVALPLAIPDFTIRHELPGCVAEPYRQQIEGSATAHFTIRSFTDLSNDKYGVTVAPVEGSQVCYGEPTSTPMLGSAWHIFKRDRTYPNKSRLYLYLMNNMWDMNIASSQPGPVSFSWSLHGHAGNWQTGGADRFGRGVQQPLIAWRADGENAGTLPASGSFMSVDAPNVTCSVIKPTEANGRGFIVRLNETAGNETTATVSLPMLKLESANATSLVENDRPERYPVAGNTFKITLPKFGVKTIRITCAATPAGVSDFSVKAVADMQTELRWACAGKEVSHFNIYRDTKPECEPTQLNFIGQSTTGAFTDRPRVNLGGWLRSCLNPNTTYHYRIVPVDRSNNPGAPSAVAEVTTLASAQANLPPVAVEGLHPVLVSPESQEYNFVNLLFRTSCEPDIMQYEIHRGLHSGFAAGPETRVCVLNSNDSPPPTGGNGDLLMKYQNKDYDHATIADMSVKPGTVYYYKVRAVDAAGQPGAFSGEAAVRTKEAPPCATAQSCASGFNPALAFDGDPDPYRAWISKQYGGGTKAQPLDVWWAVEFLKKPVTLKGVKIIGDTRAEVPVIKNMQIQVRENNAWKTVGDVKNAATKDATITFAQPVTAAALRVFVPAADIPGDGYVRVCELKFILPDGSEENPVDMAKDDVKGRGK